MPNEIVIQQKPRYGVLDVGTALSLIAEKPMTTPKVGTLKMVDIILGR